MTQETAKAVIDRLQGEAGYATGGYVDRLVFSGLDVHEMLNEIEQAIDTDKLSVEKLQEIRVEELKDFNSKILQAELKNQKLQEQLNTAKKALTEAIEDIEQLNGSDDTIKYYKQALAAIEKGENNEI